MNYLVIVRYILRGVAWKTVQREFDKLEDAEAYAREMYGSEAKEITVLVYELKKSYN